MANIIATSKAFPKNYFEQEQILDLIKMVWKDNPNVDLEKLEKFHRSVQVKGRHLALTLPEYAGLTDFESRNNAFIEKATELGKEALENLFAKTEIGAEGIDQIVFTTVTGVAVPSIDARLMNLLPFKSNTKRVPLFGLGCLAGAAGVARAKDYLKGHPKEAVVLLSIELCSLTFQLDDPSVANLISTGLFADGAAAVLLVGDEHPLADRKPISVLDSESVFFPDSLGVMGWEVKSSGFKIILNSDVPKYAGEKLGPEVKNFLAKHDLTMDDIEFFVAHPGGPRVINALEEGLTLKPGTLDNSRLILNKYGNCSSSTVLFILDHVHKNTPPRPGSYGLMMAKGPGFCGEVLLLKA